MRRYLTLFLFAFLSLAATFAQDFGTGFTSNGYYRVHNYATQRYIYVTDNKDYYNKARDSEDFQAIQLWKDPNKTISDPASVIYIQKISATLYDLKAQGTGVHDLTNFYVSVTRGEDGTYEVTATKEGVTKHLSDDRSNLSYEQGKLGTSGKGDFRKWVVDRIETNHAVNYVGIKPTIELNGKHYQPFYAAFPFKAASSGIHIYYVYKINGNKAYLKEIKGNVPASTPVIIECASANPSQNRLELLLSNPSGITDNKLSGVYFCNGSRPEQSVNAYKAFNSSTMRVFSVSNGKMVLSNNAPERLSVIETLDWVTEQEIEVKCIPANTSYLMTNASTAAVLELVFESEGDTGIRGDLNGDGKVDIADAVALLNVMATSQYNSAADVNQDQKVDIADFITILNIMAQGPVVIRGDLNGDGRVDIADAVTLLNFMATSQYSQIADVNQDHRIDIADLVTILNIIAAQ